MRSIGDLTYLEIPEKFRKTVGFYVPKELSDEIKKKEWESIFKELNLRVYSTPRTHSSGIEYVVL